MIPDATVPWFKTVLRLLALDTAVTKRMMELGLLLVLIFGAGYATEHTVLQGVKIGAGMVLTVACIAAVFMGFRLFATILRDKD
jgi:hypothetical protein